MGLETFRYGLHAGVAYVTARHREAAETAPGSSERRHSKTLPIAGFKKQPDTHRKKSSRADRGESIGARLGGKPELGSEGSGHARFLVLGRSAQRLHAGQHHRFEGAAP
jgi:hypothetical protein